MMRYILFLLMNGAIFTLYIPDSFSCQHETKIYPVCNTPEHLSDMWLSTLQSGEEQLRSLQKSRRTHRSCVWTEALSVMVFVPAQIKAIRYSMNAYPICDSPLSRWDRRSFAALQKSSQNHRSCVWTVALSVNIYTPIQYVTDTTFEIGPAQLCCVTEIEPNSPFLCVNRSPIRYGFRASTN